MIKERGFKVLTKIADALNKVLQLIEPLKDSEIVSVRYAVGRVPVSDVVSPIDHPPFDRAAFDGYATNSAYISSASESNPAILKVVGEVKTHQRYEGELKSYEAVKIDTGSPLPTGADVVIPLEDVVRRGDYIEVYRSLPPYANVSLKGEDFKKGDVIVYGGIPITPFDIPALASAGIKEVEVYRKARLSIAAVGNELRDLDYPLIPERGEIYESNRLTIASLIKELPVEIVRSELLSDKKEEVIGFIKRACEDSDIIVTTGGTSVGSGDVVSDLDELHILVHGVAIQPAKPVLLALYRNKPFVGLPGYPVATVISTVAVLKPILMKMCGFKGTHIPRVVRARLNRRVPSKIGLRHFVRVKLWIKNGEYIAEPTWIAGAGITSSLSRSDGFLIVPEDLEGFEEGDYVDVVVYRDYVSLVRSY